MKLRFSYLMIACLQLPAPTTLMTLPVAVSMVTIVTSSALRADVFDALEEEELEEMQEEQARNTAWYERWGAVCLQTCIALYDRVVQSLPRWSR